MNLFSQGFVDDDSRIANEFIVMLKPGRQVGELLKNLPEIKIKQSLSKRMNIWLLERNNLLKQEDFLTQLKRSELVKLAQFNHKVHQRSLIPNDDFFYTQWNMLNTGTPGADIGATDAWAINHNNITANGDTIVIAIVDGTFDLTHPDLNFFINYGEVPGNDIDDDGNGYIDDYYGWNIFDTAGNIDMNGGDPHAMHCAGIAAAIGNDSIGVAGVCWGAKILRVSGGSQNEAQVVASYDYVIAMRALYNNTFGAKGAFVVSTNSSFGVLGPSGQGYGANPADYPIWCAMYDSMGAYGILSAAAAPDVNVDVDAVMDVPTGCPSKYLITVTNTTSSDHIYNQAATGKITIDIGAPGSHIYSTINGSGYGYMNGTSVASPHVAGTVAAMFAAACSNFLDNYSAYPDSLALIIKDMILKGANQVSDLHNRSVSGGRLNLYHAIKNLDEYNCGRCKDTVTALVIQPSCSNSCDGQAQVNVTGTGMHTYSWSSGAHNTSMAQQLCAGFYTVTITDTAGCEQIRNFSLFAPDSIIISSINTVPVISGNPGNITVTAKAGNDTLSYSLNGINYQVPSANNTITFIVNENGSYTVYVKNENGCVVQRNVDVTTGIGNVLIADDFRVFPNPASSLLNISLNLTKNAEVKFTFINVLGETVLDETKQILSGSHTATADVSLFAEGVYFLQVSAGGYSSIKKFVIAR